SPTRQRATVDFPHPLSPTSANVSPRLMSKLTPSSALTHARFFPCTTRSSIGGDTSKYRARFETSTRGAGSDMASSARLMGFATLSPSYGAELVGWAERSE